MHQCALWNGNDGIIKTDIWVLIHAICFPERVCFVTFFYHEACGLLCILTENEINWGPMVPRQKSTEIGYAGKYTVP